MSLPTWRRPPGGAPLDARGRCRVCYTMRTLEVGTPRLFRPCENNSTRRMGVVECEREQLVGHRRRKAERRQHIGAHQPAGAAFCPTGTWHRLLLCPPERPINGIIFYFIFRLSVVRSLGIPIGRNS